MPVFGRYKQLAGSAFKKRWAQLPDIIHFTRSKLDSRACRDSRLSTNFVLQVFIPSIRLLLPFILVHNHHQSSMDDLMKHFSGLSAETSGPSSSQRSQPECANPSTARVNLSIRQRTPKSFTAFTPPNPVTNPPTSVTNVTNDTNDMALNTTSTFTESRNSSNQTKIKRGSSGFTFPNSMDLDKYRELFMRERIPSVPTVYGGSESHSASHDASSADYNGDDDDDDGDYISHFHGEDEDDETVLPASQPTLLRRLEGLNNEDATTELSRAMSTPSESPNDEGSAPSYHSLKTEKALVRQRDDANVVSRRLHQLHEHDKARDELLTVSPEPHVSSQRPLGC